MATLFTIIMALMAIAVLVDHVLKEDAVQNWREATRGARNQIDNLNVAQAILRANEWFLGLFDAIYGARWWTIRRVLRSCVSSAIALALIFLIAARDHDALNINEWFKLAMVVIGINFVADFISLQETSASHHLIRIVCPARVEVAAFR